MYNVRVKRFLDTEQLQIYSNVVASERDSRRVDRATGEIIKVKREKGDLEYNPFTDEVERMTELVDARRSAAVSHARTIHKIYDIARSNAWEWFVTLTFNKEKVNRYDYGACSKKLSQWLKNCKKTCPDMIYLVVPELHKDGAWHFHGLFANCNELTFVESGHYDKHGDIVYNVGKYKFGWSTATKIKDLRRACAYITKYVTKDLCGLIKGKKHYWASRNVSLPEVIDLIIECPKEFRRDMVASSRHVKSVESEYLDVTYIELEKGAVESYLFKD